MQAAAGKEPVKNRSRGVIVLLLVFLVLVVSRRWQQLTSPQVWDEDGTLISGFVAGGWKTLLQPLNGYLVLAPRVITGVSLTASIFYYATISTLLACVFAALVGVAVARSPSRLSGKVACAAALFLVPSDPEVFGLPLYALWWAPVLLLLVALWDEGTPALALRIAYVVVGGFSSPYLLVVLPVLWLRAWVLRKLPAERWVACAATVVATVQLRFILGGAHMAPPPVRSFAVYVVPRFCGWFLCGGITERSSLLWPAGALVLGLIGAFLFVRRRSAFAWVLVYLYLGSIASSVLRNDPAALHPFRGGPRYFFFPFFLTSWILIQLVLTAEKRWLRVAAGAGALAGALNSIPQWTRFHDDLHWQENLVSARLFSTYAVPIESDGHWFRSWVLEEPGATWDRLLQADHLLAPAKLDALPTFAYRIVSDQELAAEGRASAGAPRGDRIVLPSSSGSNAGAAFDLPANRRIRFRSGAAGQKPVMEVVGDEEQFLGELPLTTGWVTLEFSNSRLPPQFTVRILDRGQGTGEWSPVP